jgi:hypothetical protein
MFDKIFGEKMAFFAQATDSFCKTFIITLKNANFFAENWQKSQQIVIITSIPDSHLKKHRVDAFISHTNNAH